MATEAQIEQLETLLGEDLTPEEAQELIDALTEEEKPLYRKSRPEQVKRERVRLNSVNFPEAKRPPSGPHEGRPWTKTATYTNRAINRRRNKAARKARG